MIRFRILPIVALVLALAGPAGAQVAFVDASEAIDTTTVASSITWAATVGTDPNPVLLAAMQGFEDDGNMDDPQCAFNGDPMTRLSNEGPGPSFLPLATFVLVAPDTGTHNVVCTYTAGGHMVAVSLSFTGVDQTTPLGTPVVLSQEDMASSSINAPSTTGDLVVDFFTLNGTSAVAGTGQTTSADASIFSAGNTALLTASWEAGATTTTMSWDTFDGGITSSHQRGVNLNAAVGTPPSTDCQNLLLLGVGGGCSE